jgi:hypothetical protein
MVLLLHICRLDINILICLNPHELLDERWKFVTPRKLHAFKVIILLYATHISL